MKLKNYRKVREGAEVLAIPAPDSKNEYDYIDTTKTLRQLVRRYQKEKKPIAVNFREILPQLKSADRLTHLIHPYPAKLLMHIPFFFLANDLLSTAGDLVLDPFCGSGTVLLEAQAAKRRAYGADANPLARLIAKVKTTKLNGKSLRRALNDLIKRVRTEPTDNCPDVVNIRHWFFPSAQRQLRCMLEAINNTENPAIRDFFLVCLSVCVRKVSLADPRLSVPVRLRFSQYPRKHPLREKSDSLLRRLRRVKVNDVFLRVAKTNIARIERLHQQFSSADCSEIVCSDARRLIYEYSMNGKRDTAISEGSVQLIITSPPYPGAQKYIRSSSLSLGWLKLCPVAALRDYKSRTIGREEFTKAEYTRKTSTSIAAADKVLVRIRNRSPIRATIATTYLNEMRSSMQEMWRVLKQEGHIVLVAANNQIGGKEFRTVDYLRIIAEECGFSVTACLIDAIRSRGLMTKRNGTASLITREWVLVLTKGGPPRWSL